MSRLSGVSARMSPRGCYEETAPVEVQLKQPKSYVMSRDLRSFRTGCGAARHRMAPDGAGSDAKEPLQIANNVSHGWLRRQLDGGHTVCKCYKSASHTAVSIVQPPSECF